VLQWGVPNATERPSGRGPAGRLRAELGLLVRAVRDPLLYAGLGVALVLWALAWQTKSVYTLDVGGLTDNAFVHGFNDKEPDRKVQPNPPFTYRWSQAVSEITWPGLGAVPLTVTLRMGGSRPSGPAPAITVRVRGQAFPVALTNDLRDYPFAVPRGDPSAGDLTVRIEAPPFHPPGDPRELGVLVESATVTPQGLGAPRPGTVPPPADLARWAACLALIWLTAFRLAGDRRIALALLGLGALFVAWGAVAERPNLGLLAPEAPVLLLWAYPLALLARLAAGAVLRLVARAAGAPRPALPWAGGPAAAAAGALVAGFLLRVGGMVYPQFISSDITLHVHNIEKVLRGVLVWTGALPNEAPQPYPPLPYLALAPFAAIVPDLSLLLRAGVGLLDAACALPLLYLGARLGGAWAGAGAAWVYALLPAPFALFSAGVYANLFGAVVFTATLAVWGETLLARRVGPRLWAALAAGFFLTALSHYGMLIAAVGVCALCCALAWLGGPATLRRRATGGALALLAAGALAFAVYYWRFTGILLAPAAGVSATGPPGGSLAAWLDVLRRRLGPDLGAPALLAAGAGWLSLAPHARGLIYLTLAAVGAALVFAALSLVAGENIRYALLLAPFVAIGAGLFLAGLAARGRAGLLGAALLGAVLLWRLLAIWLPLIFTRYH
jgi:hypothetical protein